MKNKEIEDILKNIKYAIDEDDYWEVTKKTLIPLLSYIEQLEKENKILRENAEHNDKVVDKVNWEINILKNNRDKAIEYINSGYLSDGEMVNILARQDLLNILKGDSDNEQR